jgi:RNA polymerase sigma-70 factor (ECF subfamily)
VELTDKDLADFLKHGDEQAFQKAFTTYYKPLLAYAFTILSDKALAEELNQRSIFLKVILKRP